MKEFDNLESFRTCIISNLIDQEWEGEKVNLMTMHASKGLEFDAVFLPGWEEVYFHQNLLRKRASGRRERRLAYVGITRQKINYFVLNEQILQGDWIDSMASRFIDELPSKYLEKNCLLMTQEMRLRT